MSCFMTHFERLWRVGVNLEQGVEKLAKVVNGGFDGEILHT